MDEPSAAASGPRAAGRPEHHEPRAWRWFSVWTVIGAVGGFGVIGMLSIGLPFVVLAAVVTVWLLTRHPDSRTGLWGLVGGAAVIAGFLAWMNRGGPGEVCRTAGDMTTCQQAWNPVPFVVAAVLLLGGGVTAFALAHRQTGRNALSG